MDIIKQNAKLIWLYVLLQIGASLLILGASLFSYVLFGLYTSVISYFFMTMTGLVPALIGLDLYPLPKTKQKNLIVPLAEGILMLFGVYAFWTLASNFLPTFPDNMDWYPTPFNQTVMFVTICIAAPIIEELFFRGVLFRSMKRFGPWTAAVLSSLIFALLHSNPVQAIFIFLVAMVLCWAYNASDSVIVPIILHALNNIISFFDLGMPAIVLIVLGLGGLILIAYHCRKFRMPDFSLLKTPSMIVLIVFLVIVMVSGLAL